MLLWTTLNHLKLSDIILTINVSCYLYTYGGHKRHGYVDAEKNGGDSTMSIHFLKDTHLNP